MNCRESSRSSLKGKSHSIARLGKKKRCKISRKISSWLVLGGNSGGQVLVGFSWSDWSSGVSLKVPRAQVSTNDSVELASIQSRELKDPKSFNCKKEWDGKGSGT